MILITCFLIGHKQRINPLSQIVIELQMDGSHPWERVDYPKKFPCWDDGGDLWDERRGPNPMQEVCKFHGFLGFGRMAYPTISTLM